MDRRTIFSLVSGAAVLGLFLFVRAARLEWISASDWSVIGVLGLFLISTEGLRESGYLDRLIGFIASRDLTTHALFAALTAASGILAAVVTNDVSLFVVVPLTLGVCQRRGLEPPALIVLETMAANVGSSAMPWGNPQNIFLFHHFGLPAGSFYRLMAPPSAVMLVALCATAWNLAPPTARSGPRPPSGTVRHAPGVVFTLLLVTSTLFVLRLLPVSPAILAGIAVGAALVVSRQVLLRVDWTLLGLFAVIFLAVHALQVSPAARWVEIALGGGGWPHVFLASAGISQVISNVPAALIATGALPNLSTAGAAPHGITMRLAALLLGVNAGGLGTPIASLANLIAARLFLREGGSSSDFYRRYWSLNLAGLAVYLLLGLWALLLWRS